MLYISILNYIQVILDYDLLLNDLLVYMISALCCSCYCVVLSKLGLGFGLLRAESESESESKSNGAFGIAYVICYI